MALPARLVPAPVRRIVASMPRAFWYLWIGTLVNRLGMFVVPFLSLFLTVRRGLPPETATLVVSAYGLGACAGSFAGGWLADRAGRRPAILLSLNAGAATLLALPWIEGLGPLAAATAVAGFFVELYRPAVSAAVADLVPAADRPRAYALLYWAINVGAAIAPVLAGLLARLSYTALFVGDALTLAAYAAIVAWRVPETRPAPEAEAAPAEPRTAAPEPAPRAGPARSPEAAPASPSAGSRTGPAAVRWSAVFRDPLLLAVSGILFVAACVHVQGWVTVPLAMRADGLDEAAYGLAITVNGAVVVLFSLPLARWAGRLPRLPVLALASLLLGVGFGLTVPAHSLPAYAGAVAVWTFGEILLAPIAPALVAELAPDRLRGSYQGLLSAAWTLAHAAGPAAGGAVFGKLGSAALWTACLAVGVAGAVAFLALAPAARRRLAGGPSAAG